MESKRITRCKRSQKEIRRRKWRRLLYISTKYVHAHILFLVFSSHSCNLFLLPFLYILLGILFQDGSLIELRLFYLSHSVWQSKRDRQSLSFTPCFNIVFYCFRPHDCANSIIIMIIFTFIDFLPTPTIKNCVKMCVTITHRCSVSVNGIHTCAFARRKKHVKKR